MKINDAMKLMARHCCYFDGAMPSHCICAEAPKNDHTFIGESIGWPGKTKRIQGRISVNGDGHTLQFLYGDFQALFRGLYKVDNLLAQFILRTNIFWTA